MNLFMRPMLFLSIGCLIVATAAAQPSQATKSFDCFILVDVSGSMMGKGADSSAKAIFPQVKQNIAALVDMLHEGDNLYILPFSGRKLEKDIKVFHLQNPGDWAAAKDFVNKLDASGQVTWTWEAIALASQYLDRLKTDNADRKQVIYAYTDGLNNGPDRYSMSRILQEFSGDRSDDSQYLYILYMDNGSGGGIKEKAPNGAIDTVKRNEPIPPPRLKMIELDPDRIHIRNDPGPTKTGSFEIRALPHFVPQPDSKLALSLSFDAGEIVSLDPSEIPIDEQPHLIMIRLGNAASQAEGTHKGTLSYQSSEAGVESKGPVLIQYTIARKIGKIGIDLKPTDLGNLAQTGKVKISVGFKTEPPDIPYGNIRASFLSNEGGLKITPPSFTVSTGGAGFEVELADPAKSKEGKHAATLKFESDSGHQVTPETAVLKFDYQPEKPNLLWVWLLAGILALLLIVIVLAALLSPPYAMEVFVNDSRQGIHLDELRSKKLLRFASLKIGGADDDISVGGQQAYALMRMLIFKRLCQIKAISAASITVDGRELSKGKKATVMNGSMAEIAGSKIVFKDRIL